ncbi:unnamed protein product [Leptidea sinapis]|uniref:Peptidase S1 domain-containing protein n=1 Tax=Leptidea sinapis TaxID=189913 RepID=A0A5E4Q2I8_9NEOP|nr:unnamed protein product [Leptidea sinapis]
MLLQASLITTRATDVIKLMKVEVYVGTDKKFQGRYYEMEKVFTPNNYNPYTNDNDIAVLKLKEPLVFNERVQPIAMADVNMKFDAGDNMMTMGYGKTPDGSISSTLLKVNVNYYDQETCKAVLKNKLPMAITDKMMCAGLPGKDACQGDSGGPLVYNNIQVGIVSFGAECGKYPGVYTRISALRNFIDEVTSQNEM